MPLRLDVKRKLTARSDRVKSVDLHATEPWMLASLYNGNVHVWNIESQQLVKSFEVCDLPVRASKFVARKNWVVTGSDDMQVRVFNYNTLERIHQFEAHSDYVRCIAVHPTQPFILTCSDDMTIKLWNWDKKWACQQVFEGHSHYVMQIVINPKDNNTFASASLDRTVKVWQLGSPQPNFTLEGHQRGVNCVDYYHGGDKPYLISGADDSLVKIWDYQNKTCVQTLEGHSQNVSSVSFHPELPIILTGSEDCTVRVWHVNTYRLENTLNYGLDRVWCISALKGSNNVCFGYDEGSVMIKLGREEPAMSMDVSGKIVWARHSEIQQANLKAMADTEIQDGERLPLAVKDLGACDIYPQTIAHNPNGRFVVVCGDGEYIIYTAMALRNKAFGPALDFVWALDSSEYAIRESNFNVKLFKNFKEKKSFKPEFGSEAIFGGNLLGCRSSATGLAFYDWETQELVRRIEIQPRQVFWSENGDYVCIATDENYFILKYSPDAVTNARDNKENVTEDGIEDAFDLVGEVQEIVKTGKWVGDCFIYTNSVNRLNYYVGGEIVTIAHLDRTLYLVGYIPKENRLYLGDKELNVVSYELLVSVLEYQTAVMRRDFDTADRVLPTIPSAHRTRVAHFLEKQGFKKQALAVSTDPEHRFDLALSLGELEVCHQLAIEAGSEHKWRLVADLAQQHGDLETAQTCLLRAHDYPGLLLQATSTGNARLIREVGTEAEGQGRNNVAFLSYFLTGNLKECLELLIKTNRVPEAAFFARTYLPSEMTRVVGLWKESAGEKIAQSLADPAQYDNLFPGFTEAVKTQQFLEKQAKPIPAASAASVPGNHERNPIDEMRAAETAGTYVYVPAEGEDSSPFVDAPSPTEALLQAQSLPEDEPLLSSTSVEPVASAPVATPPPAMSSEPLIPSSAIPPPSVSPVPDPMIGGTSLKEPDVEEENLIEALPPPVIDTKSLSKEMEFESALKIGAPTITIDQPVDDDWESDEKPLENIPPVKTVEDAEAVKDLDSDENLFDNVPSVKVVEEPEGKDWESDENLCENIPPVKVVEEPEGKDWESDENLCENIPPAKAIEESEVKDWESDENLFESDSPSKEEVEEAEVDDWESEENLFESDSPLDCAQEKDTKDDILKAPNAELREDILGLEDDAIPESGAAAAVAPSSSSVGATRKFLDWDEDEAEDWGLEQKIAIDPQDQFTDCFEDVSLELRRERESPKFEVRHSPLVDLDEVKDLAAPSLIMGLPPFSASPPRGAAPFSASPPRAAAPFSASPPRGAAQFSATHRGAALFSASPPRGAAIFSASPPRGAAIFSASPPRGAAPFSASPPRGAAIFSASSPRGAAPFSASPPRGAAIFLASPPRGGGAALLEKAKPPRELGSMPMESDATLLRSNIAPLKFNAASMESEATILKPNMDLFGSEPTSLKFIAHPVKATAPPHDPPVSLGKAVEPPELPVYPKESTESLVDLAERPTELVGPLLEPATKHFTDSGKSLLDIDASSSWHHFEQDSVDPVRDNRVEQRKPYVGSGRPTIDQAQLERELELDLENVRIDDNIDPSDVNLDEEDLLAD